MLKLNPSATCLPQQSSTAVDPIQFISSKLAGGNVQAQNGMHMIMYPAANKPLIFSTMSLPNRPFTAAAMMIHGSTGSSQPPVTINAVDQASLLNFIEENDIIAIDSYEYADDDALHITFENAQGEVVVGRVAAIENQGDKLKAQPIVEVEQ